MTGKIEEMTVVTIEVARLILESSYDVNPDSSSIRVASFQRSPKR